jgi:hypothetical protein
VRARVAPEAGSVTQLCRKDTAFRQAIEGHDSADGSENDHLFKRFMRAVEREREYQVRTDDRIKELESEIESRNKRKGLDRIRESFGKK